LATRSRRPECQTGAEVSPRRNCDFAADPGVDPVTGLIYLDNRYYDPTTGQFLSVDPLNAMTQQPYSYTDDDPINGTDPTGLLCLIKCSPPEVPS
jgi:RHS repeat-associated protein